MWRGRPVNVKHAEEDAGFAAAFPDDKYTGRHIRSMLYTPVINEEGEVVAVMEALNRHFCGGAYVGPFTQVSSEYVWHVVAFTWHVYVCVLASRSSFRFW